MNCKSMQNKSQPSTEEPWKRTSYVPVNIGQRHASRHFVGIPSEKDPGKPRVDVVT